MPLMFALAIPAIWSFGRSFFASSAGAAAAGGLGGYIFGQASAPAPSLLPSTGQLIGMAGVLIGGVLLFKQVRGLLR